MEGRRIGITAARRADEQAALVRALGGIPVPGPTIGFDAPNDEPAVRGQIAKALEEQPDIAVVMTGVGAKHLVAVAERAGLASDLRATLDASTVIARGSKARGVLRRMEIRVDHVADPPSSDGLAAGPTLNHVRGMRALVICTGPADDPIVATLRSRGATVATVHPYAIPAPAESDPALRLARDVVAGSVAAITFTSANAVAGFAALCAGSDLDGFEPHASVLIAAVGPVTREALLSHGWRVDVEPETPRMGAMYHALADRLQSGGGHTTTPESGSTD